MQKVEEQVQNAFVQLGCIFRDRIGADGLCTELWLDVHGWLSTIMRHGWQHLAQWVWIGFLCERLWSMFGKNINDVTHSKSTRSLKSDRKFSFKVHFFRRPISRSHDRKDHFSSNRYFFSLFSFWGIDTQKPIGEWLIQFYSTEFAKNTQRSLCGWSSIWFRYIVDV